MEKVKYKNETKLTQEQLLSLLAKQTLPLPRMLLSMTSIVILLSVLIFFWDSENSGIYVLMSSLLGLAFIIILFLILCKKWLIKVSNKQISEEVIYRYVFYENELVIDTVNGNQTSHQVIRYEGLEKIVVKDDFAYIYVNSVSIYFVDMNKFDVDKATIIELFAPYRKRKSKR